MTERERLIELMEQATNGSCHVDIADHLLENGVIGPPCKVGDTVYRIVKMSTGVTNKHRVVYKDGKITGVITPCEPTMKYFIRCVEVTKNNFFDVCENFDKTVFHTREEAEAALRERKEDEGK